MRRESKDYGFLFLSTSGLFGRGSHVSRVLPNNHLKDILCSYVSQGRVIGRSQVPSHSSTYLTHFTQGDQKRLPPLHQMSIQAIQWIAPNDMWGMDWIGPIIPTCSVTGAAYVLLVIHCFTRFTWARPYQQHTNFEVRDMYKNQITPMFGWPRGVYSDSRSDFVSEAVRLIFEAHGVSHYIITNNNFSDGKRFCEDPHSHSQISRHRCYYHNREPTITLSHHTSAIYDSSILIKASTDASTSTTAL